MAEAAAFRRRAFGQAAILAAILAGGCVNLPDSTIFGENADDADATADLAVGTDAETEDAVGSDADAGDRDGDAAEVAENDADAGTDAGAADEVAGTDAEAGTDAVADETAGTDVETGTDAVADETAGTDAEAGTDAVADETSGTDAEVGTDAVADETAGTDAETGTDAVADESAGTDAEVGTDAAAEVGEDADVAAPPACVTGGSCDDGNACTVDSCDKLLGCTHANSTASCSDGDACTSGDVCAGGTCASGSEVKCTDDSACTNDVCDAVKGCTHPFNTASCDDGNACTSGDACSSGQCKGGSATVCSDNNVCTDDSCNSDTGCKFTNNTASCEDGDACTSGELCSGGKCSGGTKKVCIAKDDCHDAGTCDSTTGICSSIPKNDGTACSDGLACTTGDACKGGACVGSAVVCSAQDQCHDVGTCDPASGTCSNPNKTDGKSCDDQSNCTLGDKCSSGVCTGSVTVVCNDNNSCTVDSCVPASGCKFTLQDEGSGCDDGSSCTIDDACTGGKCVGSSTLWLKQYGGDLFDEVSAIIALSDGGVALAIKTRSLGFGSLDTWIYRLDAMGNTTWSISLGGSGDDVLSAGIVSGSDLVFVGSTSSKGAGSTDLWFVKLSADGKVTSDTTIGGSDEDSSEGLVATSSGFAIAGTTRSKAGRPEAWLVLTDGDGKLVSDYAYGNPAFDRALHGISSLDDGGFLLTGDEAIACCGHIQGLAIRTSSSGAVIFSKTFTLGDESDTLHAAASFSDGFLLAGAGNGDGWLVRTDLSGNKLWQTTFGSGGNDYLSSFIVQSGGVLLGGWNFDQGGSGYVIRADFSGNVMWSANYTANGPFAPGAVIAASSTNLWIGGHVEGSGGYDSSDAWIRRADMFGNSTCSSSGNCGQKAFSFCSDGNACTADSCGKGVCVNSVLASASRCDDGNACTMNEKCTGKSCGSGISTDLDGDGKGPISCGGNDCDDSSALVYPGNMEICDDGATDNNCDGSKADSGCNCPEYWIKVASDNGHSCGMMAPFWGTRAETVDVYFHNNNDGTYTDSSTGLHWQLQSQTDITGGTARSYCLGLTLGGFSDWRLPTLFEAYTLIDAKVSPTYAYQFDGSTNPGIYWIDNDYSTGTESQTISLSSGITFANVPINNLASARCVRGGTGPFAISTRFSQGSGTFTDKLTKLTWETTASSTQMSQKDAIAWCRDLTTGGLKWRLPHESELLSILNIYNGLPATWDGISAKSENYWTITPSATTGKAWEIYFGFGWPGSADSSGAYYVRCVSGTAACGSTEDCNDGDSCTEEYCDPFTHTCNNGFYDDGHTCDDGDACTMNETCKSHACTGGVPTDMDGDGYVRKGCGSGSDCDDAYSLRHPGGSEYCDGGTFDDNCNGSTDESCVCAPGYDKMSLASGSVCAPTFPQWGALSWTPDSNFSNFTSDIVGDGVTGLQWAQTASSSGLTNGNASAYCKGLSLGGKSDWRMPSVGEMESLLNFVQAPVAAQVPIFSDFDSNDYMWTGSVTPFDASQAFLIGTQSGHLFWDTFGDGYKIRCVRGSFAPYDLSKRFSSDSVNGTVRDNLTGLTWQRSEDSITFTQSEASDYCSGLATGGGGWRLPQIQELRGLIDHSKFNPTLSTTAFPGAPSDWHWSSTFSSTDGTEAWGADFYAGHSNLQAASSKFRVRCVK